VQTINARLHRPITRQLFVQSLLPLLLERGDARRLSANGYAFDGDAVRNWAAYAAWREAQIAAGALPVKHPYSIAEMEDHFHGNLDD